MKMFSARVFAASLALVFIIFTICTNEGSAGDCQIKVLNAWLNFCVNNGVMRPKRDVFQTDSGGPMSPPQVDAVLDGVAAPLMTKIFPENNQKSQDREIAVPWDRGYGEKTTGPGASSSGFGFPPLRSGDDLGIGLSHDDEMEELYKQIIDRLPRAAKNNEKSARLLTEYAESCCSDNLSDDDCSNPAEVINCP